MPGAAANGPQRSEGPPRRATQQKRLTLYRQGYSPAPTDAQGRETLLGIAAVPFEQQGGENARARCADGMADGNGAAIDVHLGGIPAHILVYGTGLGGEGFIG